MNRRKQRQLWSVVLVVVVAIVGISPRSAYAETAKKKIRFGIQTPPEVADPADLIKFWQEAEAWGYDTAWTYDHFLPITGNTKGPCLDGWMLLGALAAKTSKIRLGVLVTGNTYRHPAVLAKMATTVDLLSNGRLELGIGAGWFEVEHTAYGIPFYSAKERTRRLEEAVQIIRALWSEKETNFSGKYYQIKNAPFEPKPLQKPHPPILIGGQGPKWTLPIVAQYADIWNVPLLISPPKIAELMKTLNGYCEKFQRDCNTIEKSALRKLVMTDDPKVIDQTVQTFARMRNLPPEEVRTMLVAGSTEEVKKQIQMYIDAGITHIIFNTYQPFDRDGLQRFAKEVMPAFH
jgi:F420-dependent oxidoreductase-like protein